MCKRVVAFTILLLAASTVAWSQRYASDSIGFKPGKSFQLHTIPPTLLNLAAPRTYATPAPFTSDIITKHLPFFCGAELMIEKRLKVPLRFRLGSVSQVDWLEAKPLSVRPE